jgi:hypothetical protein
VDAARHAATHARPDTAWRAGPLVADFTFDGTLDVALLGEHAGAAVIAVVAGPVAKDAGVLLLAPPDRPGAKGGRCGPARAATLAIEEPGIPEDLRTPGNAALAARLREAASAGGRGLRLASSGCDARHVHFDGKGLGWWRR